MAHGGSHVTLAKGNRSRQVTDACKKHGRVLPRLYRRAGGDPCARVHKEVGVIEYEELGLEAIFRVDVENFPAFIVVDDKGERLLFAAVLIVHEGARPDCAGEKPHVLSPQA